MAVEMVWCRNPKTGGEQWLAVTALESGAYSDWVRVHDGTEGGVED